MVQESRIIPNYSMSVNKSILSKIFQIDKKQLIVELDNKFKCYFVKIVLIMMMNQYKCFIKAVFSINQ